MSPSLEQRANNPQPQQGRPSTPIAPIQFRLPTETGPAGATQQPRPAEHRSCGQSPPRINLARPCMNDRAFVKKRVYRNDTSRVTTFAVQQQRLALLFLFLIVSAAFSCSSERDFAGLLAELEAKQFDVKLGSAETPYLLTSVGIDGSTDDSTGRVLRVVFVDKVLAAGDHIKHVKYVETSAVLLHAQSEVELHPLYGPSGAPASVGVVEFILQNDIPRKDVVLRLFREHFTVPNPYEMPAKPTHYSTLSCYAEVRITDLR